jgi:hypothetical protein
VCAEGERLCCVDFEVTANSTIKSSASVAFSDLWNAKVTRSAPPHHTPDYSRPSILRPWPDLQRRATHTHTHIPQPTQQGCTNRSEQRSKETALKETSDGQYTQRVRHDDGGWHRSSEVPRVIICMKFSHVVALADALQPEAGHSTRLQSLCAPLLRSQTVRKMNSRLAGVAGRQQTSMPLTLAY